MGFIEKVEEQQTDEPDDEDMDFSNAHFMVCQYSVLNL